MGVENSPGHDFEEYDVRMDRILSEFETSEENAHSGFDFLASRLNDQVIASGEDVDHLPIADNELRTYLLAKVPDFADRELLAQSIYNKYLYEDAEEVKKKQPVSSWRQKYKEESETWDKMLSQGVGYYKPYDDMHKRSCDAEMIVTFITNLNSYELGKSLKADEEAAKIIENQKLQERLREEKEAEKRQITERAEEIFSTFKIKVPKRGNPAELSNELTLQDYAEGILHLPHQEQEFRISHLGAFFRLAFQPVEAHALLDEYQKRTAEARKILQAAIETKQLAEIDHEVIDNEGEALNAKITEAENNYYHFLRLHNLIGFAITDAKL